MKFPAAVRLAAAALLTGALLVPGISPAKAVTTYPPHVSVLYASPYLSGGYASVAVSGTNLTSGLKVRASSGSKSTVVSLYVDSSRTTGTALVKVSSLISSYAGRYTVNFALLGSSLTGKLTTSQTYTVGKQISIKYFSAHKKSYGLYIHGMAAKNTPMKITIKFGSKSYYRTVKASRSSGWFSYRFHKTSKGTYTLTAKVAPNKSYFSTPVTVTYRR